VAILKQLSVAMGPDSEILIDDISLPDTGAHWWPSAMDVHMYAFLGAGERNDSQWAALAQRAGLKVKEVRPYNPGMRYAITILAKN
jgi:demethylsterigmatocystin 6-O-methyltransferase